MSTLSTDHHPTLRHVDREAIGIELQGVLAVLTRILTEAIGDIRERMDRLEDVDTVTADLLHGIVARLKEQAWMIRVQTA